MHCDNWKSQEKLWHFGGKILLWQCTAVVLRDCTTYIHHCGSWGRFCVWWWWWWCDFLVRCWRKYGGGGGRTPPPPTPQTALSSSLHSSVDIMYNALTTALCCTAAVQSTQLLTHIHTLCVSKRIQTYNTLGIHLQSVKISGESSLTLGRAWKFPWAMEFSMGDGNFHGRTLSLVMEISRSWKFPWPWIIGLLQMHPFLVKYSFISSTWSHCIVGGVEIINIFRTI